jgi:Ca2+-binding RTX toxin-like protein
MHIDKLENRRLFAVTTEYDPARQVLRFFGDERRDSVIFSRGRGGETLRAVVNGQQQRFNDPIRLISMSMGLGGDTVILGAIAIPMVVRGGKGPDTISGGLANDTIFGDGGFDYLYGREGDDVISGGLQGDQILGADGNDTLTSGSALLANDDTIFGGNGEDVVDYSESAQAALLEIGNMRADPDLISDFIFSDVETVRGTSGDDQIRNATRRGLVIEGLAGNDSLVGGSGGDTLVGGAGNDTLVGNGGRDAFDALDSEADTITGGGGTDVLRSTDDGIDVVTTVP